MIYLSIGGYRQGTERWLVSHLGLVAEIHIGVGYVLALLVEACIQYQSHLYSGHRDLIHVTAHFLRTTAISPFEVQVRTLKAGRGFTNVVANLVQRVHLLYQRYIK